MKNLLKLLSPFAPDQSGASAVLYELGGLMVICDAGGCAGNVCGFDEPRWFTKKSAVFSAGLRDMDAILGRDDRLIEKLSKACEQISRHNRHTCACCHRNRYESVETNDREENRTSLHNSRVYRHELLRQRLRAGVDRAFQDLCH